MKAFKYIAIFLCVSISACDLDNLIEDKSSHKNNTPYKINRPLTFTISGINLDTLQLLNRTLPSGTNTEFSLIPGHLYGEPNSGTLMSISVTNQNNISLNFTPSIFTDSNHPEPISIQAANYGLDITPKDVEFGRVSTLVDGLLNTAIALYDKKNDSIFSIVYFNGAAQLTGMSGNSSVDIEVSEAGFYAIGLNYVDGSYTNKPLELSDELYFVFDEEFLFRSMNSETTLTCQSFTDCYVYQFL